MCNQVALISDLPLRENASVQSKLAYAKCESDWIISEWWCAFQSFHYIKISYDFRRNGVMSSFLELDSPLTRCQLPAKHVFVFSWRDKEWRLNDDRTFIFWGMLHKEHFTLWVFTLCSWHSTSKIIGRGLISRWDMINHEQWGTLIKKIIRRLEDSEFAGQYLDFTELRNQYFLFYRTHNLIF